MMFVDSPENKIKGFWDQSHTDDLFCLPQARPQLLAASAGGAVAPGSGLLSQHPLRLRVKSLTSHFGGVSQEKHCLR